MSDRPIPLVDLGYQQRQVAEDVRAGWEAVLERTAFVLGDEVATFEQAYADFTGVTHCVGVANGTDALEMALRAHDIGPGDEVIVPANTFVASALAVRRSGATPVLVDVDADHLLIEPVQVAEAAGPRTRAIMPVHLYGQMAPMHELAACCDPDLTIVEDCAQAHGATQHGAHAGTFGTISGTSFYPGKNLGAYGDGGAVLTGDDGLARRVRALRNYGSEQKYVHDEIGFNSRLDTLQAVVLTAKLARLEQWNRERQEASRRYERLLDGVERVRTPGVAPGNAHVWHLYVVRVPGRDDILRGMAEKGVHAGIHYPTPVHRLGAFRDLGYSAGDFPVTEAASLEILSLPIYPGITEVQQERVVDALLASLRPS
jgi:dTDP-4-amino-4,6-dideoxygalactose transaminase